MPPVKSLDLHISSRSETDNHPPYKRHRIFKNEEGSAKAKTNLREHRDVSRNSRSDSQSIDRQVIRSFSCSIADRIKILVRKRTSLKSQITGLSNILDKGRVDNVSLKLRMERLTALFHAFEENSDELAGLDPNKAHFAEFANVQERYYSLAARVVNILHAAGASEASTSWSTDEARNDNRSLATVIQKRRIKLPETSLPTFDGKYKGWLSFKNAFNSMIGSQSDLFDVDKLHYLKSALTGKATNKIRILAIDGTNYAKAWQLLERAYEVKRILIS